jgi:predicted secreted protein
MAEVKWDINDLINGDDLLLYLAQDKKVIAYATSCSVQVDAETIDVSSKFSPRWANNLGGRASYTISADALYCEIKEGQNGISFNELLQYMITGDAIEWYVGRQTDEETHALNTELPYYSGRATVSSVSLEAGNNEIASCSITLTGAGAIVLNKA